MVDDTFLNEVPTVSCGGDDVTELLVLLQGYEGAGLLFIERDVDIVGFAVDAAHDRYQLQLVLLMLLADVVDEIFVLLLGDDIFLVLPDHEALDDKHDGSEDGHSLQGQRTEAGQHPRGRSYTGQIEYDFVAFIDIDEKSAGNNDKGDAGVDDGAAEAGIQSGGEFLMLLQGCKNLLVGKKVIEQYCGQYTYRPVCQYMSAEARINCAAYCESGVGEYPPHGKEHEEPVNVEAKAGEDAYCQRMRLFGKLPEDDVKNKTHNETGKDVGHRSENEAGGGVAAVAGGKKPPQLRKRGGVGTPHAAKAVDEAGESSGSGAEQHSGMNDEYVDKGNGYRQKCVVVKVAER